MHRIVDHKSHRNPNSHTSRYKIDSLVYYERIKKIELIVRLNPDWRDLSLDWGKPIEPFDERKLKPPTTFI